MKVILLKDIEKLGPAWAELEVKDGYARNYLFPKNLAIKSSKEALETVSKKKEESSRREKKFKEELTQVAAKIAQVSCTIPMEAGAEDNLFGAVTSEMIAESLQSEGVTVDKKKIILAEPIKSLGVHNVEIRLDSEIKAELKVWIIKK